MKKCNVPFNVEVDSIDEVMEECEDDSVESVRNEVITVVENNGVLSNFDELSLLVEVANDGVLADTVDSFSFVDLSFVI